MQLTFPVVNKLCIVSKRGSAPKVGTFGHKGGKAHSTRPSKHHDVIEAQADLKFPSGNAPSSNPPTPSTKSLDISHIAQYFSSIVIFIDSPYIS